jgi:hypothetical protein
MQESRLAKAEAKLSGWLLTESPEELRDLLGNSATDKRRARGQVPQ